MSLDPMLLEILACPEDKGPLFYLEDEDILYNPRLRRIYRIEDDIPIMLVDEASEVDEGEHARILEMVFLNPNKLLKAKTLWQQYEISLLMLGQHEIVEDHNYLLGRKDLLALSKYSLFYIAYCTTHTF